jgi:hypothetical protein
MANPTGELSVKAKGQTYRLHFGMSVIADLQTRFGEKFEAIIQGEIEDGKLPDMNLVFAILEASLQRYHADVVDRWLVDDIVAENKSILPQLLFASSAEPTGDAPGGNAPAAA